MEITWFDISLLLISVFVGILTFIKWSYKYWERRNVTYLEPSFPMGNLEAPWSVKKGFHGIMFDIYKEFKARGCKYGGVFASLRPIFVPIDLELIKSIMIKDFQHFVDRGIYYHEKADPLSAHISSLEGERWRSLRGRLSPTFTSGKMKYMFDTVMNCAAALEVEIEKLYIKKEPIDIKEMAALFTTNVVGSCVFGLDFDVFTNPNNEFRSHARYLFKGGFRRLLTVYCTLSFPKLCKILGVRVFPEDLTKFFYDVMKNVTQLRESGAIKRNDFVQLLVEIKNGANGSEDSLTFDEIAAQAFAFYLAGYETSASSMTFAFYEMAKNQAVQDKARDEIRAVTQKYGGKITYEAIMEMTYLGQVFDEALRKYPIVPTLQRVVTKDYRLPGEDLILKEGTKVLISVRGIQNDPELFPNPEKFDPDRFSPENKLNHHVCEYMPFGEGPRICIGMRFGIMEAKIGMAIMLRNYKYSLRSELSELEFSSKSPFLSPIGQVLFNMEKVG